MLVLGTSLILICLSQFQKQSRLRKSKTFKKYRLHKNKGKKKDIKNKAKNR